MRLEKINDRWYGAMLESRNTVKYGKLTWVSNSPTLNLERNTTFGLCTYYDDRNELDIEMNQWPGYDEHVWFSKQPASVDNHPENISYGVFSSNPYLNDKNIVYSIEWTPNYVYYSVTAGDGTIIQDWTYSDPEGIPAINSTICMCLLPLAGSYYPASGNAAEVVLSSFTYTPYDPSWTESKQKPVASFSASPASGSAPLKVELVQAGEQIVLSPQDGHSNQKQINDALLKADEVYLTSGIYKIDNSIFIDSDTILRGDPDAIIQVWEGSDQFFTGMKGLICSNGPVDNILIEGFQIVTNSPGVMRILRHNMTMMQREQ
jgi:hypothetical protein